MYTLGIGVKPNLFPDSFRQFVQRLFVPQENSLYVTEFCPNVFFQVKHPLPCLGKMGQDGLVESAVVRRYLRG
jgi:hypothetical protein